MRKMTRLLVAAIVTMSLVVAAPALAVELNLGFGHPLYGTHTKDSDNHFDGQWLIFGSVDKEIERESGLNWLSYGMMYNYARIEVGIEEETIHKKKPEDICARPDFECRPIYDEFQEVPVDNPNWDDYTYATSHTVHTDMHVHVLGPYHKPFFKLSKRTKMFITGGAGIMYVDGAVHGDALGLAGFASAGASFDITENFGLTGQMLYVRGLTDNINQVGYYAPVLSLKYSF